jgi:hypothetical protein
MKSSTRARKAHALVLAFPHQYGSNDHHNTVMGQNLARLQSRLVPRSNWLGESTMLDQFSDERTEEVLMIFGGALIAASLAVVYSLFV